MIQFKLPNEGAVLKNSGGDEVFMNPERDIAHAFGSYVTKTFDILSVEGSPLLNWYFEQGGTEQELFQAAKFLYNFASLTSSDPDIANLADISKQAGYADIPLRARLVVGHAMMNVVISAFFFGYREAHMEKADPYPELEVPSKEFIIKRWLKAFFRACLNALG